MSRTQAAKLKSVEPVEGLKDTNVPDLSTQLRISRAYGKVMEAISNRQQASINLKHWQDREKALTSEYVEMIEAIRRKLPNPPEGKYWIDELDGETKELRFRLGEKPPTLG